MNLSTIASAVQHEVPIVIVIFADGQYSLIQKKQERAFGTGRAVGVGLPDPKKVDLAGAAEKLGAELFRITKPEQINQAFISTAFDIADSKKKPVVIYVPVNYALSRELEAAGTDVTFRWPSSGPSGLSKSGIQILSAL